MSRDILSEYGPESPKIIRAPATRGGVLEDRDVMNYAEPTGPINRHRPSPGLPGGTNVGTGPNMGATGDGGGANTVNDMSQRSGGENFGCCGSQGRYE